MEKRIDRIERVQHSGATSQVQDSQLVVPPADFAAHSPFLLLNEDWFGAPGGFETHPHRGMQTVTIVLEGALEHRDHTGAHGLLRTGDVQWMTAGRGVLHSEMPHGKETAHTLQLWLNLPRAMKMIPARYQDQRLADTPVRRSAGAQVRVYAGRSGDVGNPHGSDWPMTLLDLRLEKGAKFVQEVPACDRGFVYVLAGRARLGANEEEVEQGDVAWFEPGAGEGSDALSFSAEEDFRGLLFSGAPIDEPVVAYGPFVMNTRAEIAQAFADYQNGQLAGR
ncbi:MAG: pirin family protein [Burkholderiales bacterium]